MSALAERRPRVRPDRELGQNFLTDRNILPIIARAARLGAGDVVLEIGGGHGALSAYLAERVAHVHVVEIDRRLEPALLATLERFRNVTVHWGDALRVDLPALDPPPRKLVANLPYGVATAVLLRTIDELPAVACWVAMVQREVGERLVAAPARGAYGATSVIVQLACHVEVVRAIPRTVFQPVPNVDSVLVSLHRVAPPPPESLRDLVYGAFAHRRKTIAGSLALARGIDAAGRERVREALTVLGHPADARAERLSPHEFQALAELLAEEGQP